MLALLLTMSGVAEAGKPLLPLDEVSPLQFFAPIYQVPNRISVNEQWCERKRRGELLEDGTAPMLYLDEPHIVCLSWRALTDNTRELNRRIGVEIWASDGDEDWMLIDRIQPSVWPRNSPQTLLLDADLFDFADIFPDQDVPKWGWGVIVVTISNQNVAQFPFKYDINAL